MEACSTLTTIRTLSSARAEYCPCLTWICPTSTAACFGQPFRPSVAACWALAPPLARSRVMAPRSTSLTLARAFAGLR
eukprot:10576265-Alexandrium_andersonii.AAC.1